MKRRRNLTLGYESPTFSKPPATTIEQYCRDHGLELVTVLRDDDSSRHLDLDHRPAGRQIIGMCRREKIKNIVAADLFSLFKDAVDAGRQVPRWQKKRIRLHLLNLGGQPYVVEEDTGQVIGRVIEALGRMERRNRRERIGASLAKRKVRGFVYGGTPYGYDRVGGLLVQNSQEMQVIRRIQGLRKEGKSFHAIAGLLNREGVPTKKSAKWYASTVTAALSNPIHRQWEDQASWELPIPATAAKGHSEPLEAERLAPTALKAIPNAAQNEAVAEQVNPPDPANGHVQVGELPRRQLILKRTIGTIKPPMLTKQ
jgi:DNA invertase Pin-like site-specific DNA recombinase